MAVEIKIRLREIDLDFLKKYESLGFDSEEDLLSKAIVLLKKELVGMNRHLLEDSADLYTELYENDEDSKEWIEASNKDWE